MTGSQRFFRILKRNPSAMAGFCIIVFYALMATVGPLVVPLSTAENPANAYLGPSWHHLLGTDFAGRDTLAEIIHGSTPVLMIGVLASSISVAVGVVVGLISGFIGGLVDSVFMRFVDVVLTIPSLPLIIVLVAFIHASNPVVQAAIISITGWAGLARAVRTQALSLTQREFIEAARVQGLSLWHILFRQLLPNMGPYVVMNFLLGMTGAIYAEVGLFFLGIAPFTASNWGVMLNFAINQSGAIYSSQSMLYLFSPMCAIVLLQLGLILFTKALDQIFNPRLRAV